LQKFICPVRGQILLTKPILNFKFKYNIMTNDGYEYMIHRDDGRIVMGGMRWRSKTKEEGIIDDSTVNPIISSALMEFLQDMLAIPKEELQIEQEWTGIMGFTLDERPLIGILPRNKFDPSYKLPQINEYIAAGFHGEGMPKCFQAGKVIADMIAGKLDQNNFIKPFLPERFFE